jgi:hypothetical protein
MSQQQTNPNFFLIRLYREIAEKHDIPLSTVKGWKYNYTDFPDIYTVQYDPAIELIEQWMDLHGKIKFN